MSMSPYTLLVLLLYLAVCSWAVPSSINSRIILGISSPTISPKLLEKIQDGLGGVILTGKTWRSPQVTQVFCQKLRKVNPNLLICIDQEGGSVSRIQFPLKFPSAQWIGRNSSIHDAHRWGIKNGQLLSSVGINVNFAPVLDVITTSQNKVIGSRSFSHKEALVSELGVAYMKGLQASGIMSVIKHFPGHGDTILDSHEQLPVNPYSRNYLEAISIAPFYRAIQEGAEAIMLSHIVYPALDPVFPASLSKKWVRYLRKDLQFKGLIFTDDIAMKAITTHYSQKEAVQQAINAGVDYIIITNGLTRPWN